MQSLNILKNVILSSMVVVFIGCSSSNDSSQTSNQLSGQVVDGYIKDATVCIDVNNNALCDSDEPYSKSDENGSFILKLDKPYSGNYTLLSKGGVDIATNEFSVGTLSNIVTIDSNTSELVARITPLTTLAVIIANTKHISIEEAKAEVAEVLGLNSTDIDADPMKNAKVFEQTQIVVQSSKKIVQVILGNDSNIDINNTFDTVMQKIAEDISDNPTQKDINISSVISAVSEATSVELSEDNTVNIESFVDAVKEILSEDNITEDLTTLQNDVDINIVVQSTPVFTSSTTAEVDENQLNVMTAHATDAEGNLLIYKLSGTDASYFTINSVTGEIKLKEPLDYEATSKHTYNFDVEASNGVNSATQAISVTLKNVYEIPTLDLDSNTVGTGYVTTFTEGDAFVKCDGDVVIKTDDNSSLQSATIKLTNAQPDDSLYVDASSEFQIDIDNRQATDSEIVVTITGEASSSNYEQEIASLQFSNESDNPSTQQRHIEVSVNDGYSNSLTATCDIDVKAVNDAPVAEDANLSVHFNLSSNDIRNSITINMLDYMSDPDSDLNLSSFEVMQEPLHGDLNCSDLVCTYTPDLDYDGNDSFGYTIADIEGLRSDQGTISLNVEKYGALQLVINNTTSSFTIPVDSDLEYNYNIDCDSDGEYDDVNVTGEYTCNVDTNDSVYIISIYGKFPHLTFEDADCSSLVGVSDWGVVELTDFSYTFYKCIDLDNGYFSEKGPDLSHVTSMHSAFESSDFNASVEDWNVSNIEDMVRVFYDNGSFNHPLNKWDVSHVTTMVKMFETNSSNPSTFNQPIGDWNVSNVIYTSSMFQGAVEFNQSVENWDTSSFKEVDAMFKDASSFSDHDLSDWNVTNVTIHDYFLDGAGPNNIEPNWPDN